MNFQTALGRLRIMGLLEGISWAFLLTSMFLKYGPGLSDETRTFGKLAVTIVGSIHGGLFVFYVIAVINAWLVRGWRFRGILGLLASIPPFGTFLFDVSLKREQQGV